MFTFIVPISHLV